VVRNHLVKFKVSREEKERIRQTSSAYGYESVGAFLRHLSLTVDYHEKLNAIYEKLRNS
jgi:hypothetical protein